MLKPPDRNRFVSISWGQKTTTQVPDPGIRHNTFGPIQAAACLRFCQTRRPKSRSPRLHPTNSL